VGGGGALPPARNPAAARRGNPPESGNLDPPGVKTSGALAWEGQRLMRDPLEPSARCGGGRSGVSYGGVARRRNST